MPLFGGFYKLLIYSCSSLTSLSSHNISSIRSVILFPSSPFLTLKTFYISKSFIKSIIFSISIWCPLLLIMALSHSSLHYTKLVLVILSAGKIMLSCSHCAKKGLVYVTIASPTSCQLLSCAECTKANMRSSYDVHSISNAKYTLLISLYNLLVLYLIYYKVLYLNSY